MRRVNDSKITRRSLLKIGVLGGPLLLLRPVHANAEPTKSSPAIREPVTQESNLKFGRVFFSSAVVREQTIAKAVTLRRLSADEVIPLFGQVVGEGPTTRSGI